MADQKFIYTGKYDWKEQVMQLKLFGGTSFTKIVESKREEEEGLVDQQNPSYKINFKLVSRNN